MEKFKTIKSVTIEAGRSWMADECGVYAAAIAYYVGLSIFPLMLALVAIVGFAIQFTDRAASAMTQIVQFVQQTAGNQAAELIEQVLKNVRDGADVGGPLGIIALIWIGGGVFQQLFNAFDRIYQQNFELRDPGNQGIKQMTLRLARMRLKSVLSIAGTGILIFLAFLFSLISSVLSQWLESFSDLNLPWWLLDLGINALIMSVLFAMLYKLSIWRRVAWSDALICGSIVAILWMIIKQLLVIVALGSRYSIYGIIGSFIAVLIWAYVGGVVVLYGAELLQVITQRRQNIESAGKRSL